MFCISRTGTLDEFVLDSIGPQYLRSALQLWQRLQGQLD